jgi:ABC-type phosphate/phosphonate transport system substrate-binding protein
MLLSGLMSYKTTASSGFAKKETINIQFVPSRDLGQLATLASNLEQLLNKKKDKYEFRITTGTSYAATTEAMLSAQVDVGFLTASGYAEVL